ncbi:MAG: PFL family protein [Clostridiales bacterium]|nr:PFL family protein [Clostridiales bacterium]
MTIYKDVLETIHMIEKENLDIRTTTMGISLLDCFGRDHKEAAARVYDKITRLAEKLVETADEVGDDYGINIVNKRISVTPIALTNAGSTEEWLLYAKALDNAAKAVGVDIIGGFSALVHKGCTASDESFIEAVPYALAETDAMCSSINLGSTKSGINMDAVKKMGPLIKKTAYLTRENNSFGCAKFVAFANAVEDNPFMAGAFHGVGEAENVINVGVSGPGVVREALRDMEGASVDEIAEKIKQTAFKITRAGQLIGRKVSDKLGVPFGILDLSLAPTPAIGDSVAEILETMGLERCGAHGSTAALAMLTDAVKKGGIMASGHVGGLSGAFIPVSEDNRMIAAAEEGCLTFDKLEAMTSVCSVGLDMIAIPGDTPEDTISAMIADEAAIGVINNKTTAVRVIPAYGMKAGDKVDWGGLFGSAPVMEVNTFSSSQFIQRGGRIPAPVHSFKN